MNTRDVEPRYLLMKAQIADTYDLIRGHLERPETFFSRSSKLFCLLHVYPHIRPSFQA